jgi:(E)-4-hydroxy-3-methylbut-2-enyl-diphosphate synthase
MSYAENPIKRRQSTQIKVGNVLIGGDAPYCSAVNDQY